MHNEYSTVPCLSGAVWLSSIQVVSLTVKACLKSLISQWQLSHNSGALMLPFFSFQASDRQLWHLISRDLAESLRVLKRLPLLYYSRKELSQVSVSHFLRSWTRPPPPQIYFICTRRCWVGFFVFCFCSLSELKWIKLAYCCSTSKLQAPHDSFFNFNPLS